MQRFDYILKTINDDDDNADSTDIRKRYIVNKFYFDFFLCQFCQLKHFFSIKRMTIIK